jgi:hypothetical protein
MTDIPAGAQRSDDGQWWWDGSQWQRVATQAAAGAAGAQPASDATESGAAAGTADPQPASGATGTAAAAGTADPQPASGGAAPGSSTSGGQLSADGQWRWDGTEWQPVHADPAASAGSAAETPSELHVTLGVPTAAAHTVHDGTTEVVINYTVTNAGSTRIEAHGLQMGFFVLAAGQTAETAAYVTGAMPVALAPGEEHRGDARMQVDPGARTVFVNVSDTATGAILATSDDVAFEVAGHQAADHAFDDTQTYQLTLSITSVEHVSDALYRVHYDVQADRDVPAGLRVSGRIEGPQANTGQLYDLTSALEAGRAHPHYLTMEAVAPSHSTAYIMLDPGGPSEKSESVVVDIADDGTPTMSR